MRFLLDQGLPRSAASHLHEMGHDAVHVSQIGLADADDHAIIRRGREDSRVVVTRDADFRAILARAGACGPSVIRIRIEGLKGRELAILLNSVAHGAGSEIDRGAILSVQEHGIRIRDLPLD